MQREGLFASRVQHEGESGPEGLSSFPCFLLVQRKYRAHLLSAELPSHVSLFFLSQVFAAPLSFSGVD